MVLLCNLKLSAVSFVYDHLFKVTCEQLVKRSKYSINLFLFAWPLRRFQHKSSYHADARLLQGSQYLLVYNAGTLHCHVADTRHDISPRHIIQTHDRHVTRYDIPARIIIQTHGRPVTRNDIPPRHTIQTHGRPVTRYDIPPLHYM